MSYQRAIVNCKTCRDILSNARSGEGMQEFTISQYRLARNEAMKALEHEVDIFSKFDTPNATDRAHMALHALDCCRQCNYSRTNVAGIENFYASLSALHKKILNSSA